MVFRLDSLGPLHRAHSPAWLPPAVNESAPISIAYPTPSNVLGFATCSPGNALVLKAKSYSEPPYYENPGTRFTGSIRLASPTSYIHCLSKWGGGTHRPEPLKGKLRPVPTFVHRGSDIGAKEFQDV